MASASGSPNFVLKRSLGDIGLNRRRPHELGCFGGVDETPDRGAN